MKSLSFLETCLKCCYIPLILTVIEFHSRRAWSVPQKNKTPGPIDSSRYS